MKVTDLRGAARAVPEPVLADPSGRRAVLLHRVGRVIGLLFLVWFVCLVLAGLGLLPASGVPLAGSVAPRTQPLRLSQLPRPKPTPAADLRPAKALRSLTGSAGSTATPTRTSASKGGPTTTKHSSHPAKTPTKHLPPTTTLPSSSTTTVPLPATHGNSQSTTTPGKSTTAPGHSTTKPGNGSGTTTTTTTTPGRSGSAPGQTRTTTTGHGPPPK